MVVSAAAARSGNLKPLARIVAHASHAQAPEWFTTAPVGAIQAVLAKTGWNANQVDLYEVNEAFACVAMAAIHDLKLDPAREEFIDDAEANRLRSRASRNWA